MALLPDKEKLLRNFCRQQEEKYLYIIELGQRLPELRDEDRSPQNSIQGCQSRCGLSCARMPRELLNYRATAMRRLKNIAVVFILYDQMTPQDIVISMCVRG